MGKINKNTVEQGQTSIKSFFKSKQEDTQNKPITPETLQNTTDSDNNDKKENNDQTNINKQNEEIKSQQEDDKVQNDIQEQQLEKIITQRPLIQSKRSKLQINGNRKKIEKIYQKTQEKQQLQKQINEPIQEKENSNNFEFGGDNLALETFLEDEKSNSKGILQKNNNIKIQIEEQESNQDVFISEGEGEEGQKNSVKKQKKKQTIDQDEEEEDYYKKVLEMTDDESESKEQNLKRKTQKKKKLDDSFNLSEEQGSHKSSDDESYDDGSDFSSEIINQGRKRGSTGRRNPVSLGEEPMQRKQRKVILTKNQIQKLKYPYEIAQTLTLISPGTICTKKAYHSKFNFFPIGYKCERNYPSYIHKDERTNYISEILEGKKDKPLFQVTADDDKEHPIKCESSSQCWKQIAEAVKKLNVGKKKVSISGPEMFGLQNQVIQQILENLENADKCVNYYANANKQNSSGSNNELQQNESGDSEQ